MLEVCEEIGIPFYEDKFTINDLLTADEIIVTSSTKLCRSVGQINDKMVGGHATDVFNEIRLRLNRDYLDIIC